MSVRTQQYCTGTINITLYSAINIAHVYYKYYTIVAISIARVL